MIFYVIFGDFVGWDWGTPAILQQKHPWKNWIKIWDWQTPPLSWDKRPNFPPDSIWGLPLSAVKMLIIWMLVPVNNSIDDNDRKFHDLDKKFASEEWNLV